MTDLWTKEKEIQFFEESTNFATPEQLFYVGDDFRYYAYWPKSYRGKKSTLQSRNALIGSFTEKYSVDLLQDFANSQGLYAVQSVICNEIGLSAQSPADVAFCKTRHREQFPTDIKTIFEVKMSIVWNWELRNNQGFWSVNPKPLDDNGDNIKQTPSNGFIRMDSYSELEKNLGNLPFEKQEFFSSMKSKKELGKIIEIASREPNFEMKAEKFLSLIRT